MTCDVCGASDPPRNPTWRSNTEKVCDPCWDRLQAAIRERTEALVAASPSVTEPETRREPDVTRHEYDERDEQIWNEAPPRDGIDQYAREADPFYTAVRGERREPMSNEAAEIQLSGPQGKAATEALQHLFFVMERLDRQAGPPFSADHMVTITTETWLDLVRPAIQTVRAALDEIGDAR